MGQTMTQKLMCPEMGATDYAKFNCWDAGRATKGWT
jgi:hypothetical protein